MHPMANFIRDNIESNRLVQHFQFQSNNNILIDFFFCTASDQNRKVSNVQNWFDFNPMGKMCLKLICVQIESRNSQVRLHAVNPTTESKYTLFFFSGDFLFHMTINSIERRKTDLS